MEQIGGAAAATSATSATQSQAGVAPSPWLPLANREQQRNGKKSATDFHTNKKILEEVAITPSKRHHPKPPIAAALSCRKTITSRAEAERLLGIAEKLLRGKDFGGCRDFAILAQETEPLPEGSDQILAVAEVLVAADNNKRLINNQPVRGVGGPAPGMMQPQISRPPQISVPPMPYPQQPPVVRPPSVAPSPAGFPPRRHHLLPQRLRQIAAAKQN